MISHTSINYDFHRKYRFVLTSNVTFYLTDEFPATDTKLTFCDKEGKPWLTIEGRCYTIRAGYAWNGCSPRPLGRFGIWWLGTPDFPASIMASLAHDAGYQMLDCRYFPFTRAQVDLLFLRVMQLHRFPLAQIYYRAVRTCGGLDRVLTA